MIVDKTRRRFLCATAVGTASLALPFAFRGQVWAATNEVLSVAIPSNPQTLDPINQPNHDVMAINQLIFENLVSIDANGRRVPQLAQSWEISEDKKTYTFDLRRDVTFHNGQPFSATDVKYSFDYVRNPDNKAFRRQFWSVIESTTVVDTYIVEIKLTRPYRPFLDNMNKYMGIFPVGSREKYGADAFKYSPVGLGTGPAIFVRAKNNDFVELRSNPNYWAKNVPQWRKLVFRVIPEESSRLASLLSSQTQIISSPPAQSFAKIRNSAGLAGDFKSSPTSPLAICMNTQKPPFDDIKFRQAASLVLDREQICNDICYGAVSATATPYAKDSPWFDAQSSAALDFNLEKAKALLKESKYATGASFELLYVTPAYLIDTSTVALVVQAQFAKIGVSVNLKPVDFGQMISQLAVGNHMAALAAFIAPPEPTYFLNMVMRKKEGLSKAVGYDNPQLTQLLDDSYLFNDDTALQPTLNNIQRLLAQECPIVWIGSLVVQNLWRREVKDFTSNSGFTLKLENVSLS
ncbi:Periplasmic dipeptide transport protein precursor [compost metagenome]